MTHLLNQKPSDFNQPIKIPLDEDKSRKWQELNQKWWEANPMRYDWKKIIVVPEFSKEFYLEIDTRHFSNAEEYICKKNLPFDTLIDFPSLASMDVLEIGIGNGSHAQLLASHAGSFVGIDITKYAVKSTSERFRLFNLQGEIKQMDAERLDFPDASFDFVWSWGVIHHSSNTLNVLKEIHRVLRPGGKTIIMVYHRGWWNYYLCGILQGIITGSLLRTKSLHKSVQCHTDGAIARYYTIAEWFRLTFPFFIIKKIFVTGPKADILIYPAGRIKSLISRLLSKKISLLMTHGLKMGSFLVVEMKKSG